MNEKWFDECSVVAYPHEIRFLNIDGGSINYCVDRHVSEYVSKIQAQLNTLQNENLDKDIKNMILQSKIDKAIELKHNWQNIKENATIVFDNNSLIEFMNNLENILKEDK